MFSAVLVYLLVSVNESITFEDNSGKNATKTIEEMAANYENDLNAMIAERDKDAVDIYEDFYDEFDNQVKYESSMNLIFFGPPHSFMRMDPETLLHILINTKTYLIPIAKVLLAWDLITDGKTAAFLQGREYMTFGNLLNVVPEEDLYYVNFADPSVLFYFATSNINLHNRKYGVLVAAYRRYYGPNWYTNGSRINELGYLLCGFPSFDLQLISPITFKEISVDLLNKLDRCSANQTKTLYEIATHPNAYGEPYKWSAHEVGRLGSLFTCIPQQDISSIQLEAMPAITYTIMKKIDQKKLEYFTKQQILRMNLKARRVYLLRVQLRLSLDMDELTRRRGLRAKTSIFMLFVNIVTLVYIM